MPHLDFDDALAFVRLDDLLDLVDRLLEQLDRARLVGRVRDHDVQRRGDQPDLDRYGVRLDRLARLQRFLDREHARVRKAGQFDVGADFDGLRRQAAGDVALEVGQDVGLDR